MTKHNQYSPETRERAANMVLSSEHEYSSRWSCIQSVASKIGCTPETLRSWVTKLEASTSDTKLSNDEASRLKALERENKELKKANEILKKAAAFFAQAELDRKPK